MERKNENQPLLTMTQAADYLNVSKVTIRRWTNEGQLPCLRIGVRNERRFIEADLVKFATGPQRTPLSKGAEPCQQVSSHRCIVCNSAEHEWDAVGNEILTTLREGAQVVFIGGGDRKERLAQLLNNAGLDARKLVTSGALRQWSVEESYLLSGVFAADRMIAFVESTIFEAKARGFEKVLIVGYGGWFFCGEQAQDAAALAEFMNYEMSLNEVLERHPNATVICPYVLPDVSARVIVDAFCVHPTLQFESTYIDGLPRYLNSDLRPASGG